MIAAVLSVLLMTAAGLPIAMTIHRGARWDVRAGEAFFLGSGWTTIVMLLQSLAHVRWTFASVGVAVTAPFLLLVPTAFSQRPNPEPREREQGERDALSHVINLFTALAVIGYAFYVTLGPMWEMDFWAIFGAKGRAFFDYGGVDWSFLTSPYHSYMHPDYPLMLPLLFDVVAMFNGAWDDRAIGLLYPAFTIALLLVARPLIRRETNSGPLTAVAILIVSGLSFTTTAGTADAPLIALSATGLLLARDGLAKNDAESLRAAAILLGLAAWTKSEGAAMIVSTAIAAFVQTRRWKTVMAFWPGAVIAAAWIGIARVFGLQSAYLRTDSLITRVVEHVHQWRDVAGAFASTSPEHLILWPAAAMLLAIAWRQAWSEKFLLTFVAAQLAFYAAAYAVTPFPLLWQIRNSFPRLLSHVAIPLAIAALAAGAAYALPRHPSEREKSTNEVNHAHS